MSEKKKASNKKRASPTKIAYYAQSMAEKGKNVKEIILIITDLFDRRDVKEFANKYKNCRNIENVRYVADLIYYIPIKNMDKTIDYFINIVSCETGSI